MENTKIMAFAANRIQEKENLPAVSPELIARIRDLVRTIDAMPAAIVGHAVEDVLKMLNGIPATESLQLLAHLLDRHPTFAQECLVRCPSGMVRAMYLDRLKMLGELFAPPRMQRIADTARYIEVGWGV